jgi:proteic killer suppression protein
LEISFETKELRALCEDEALAAESFGSAVAQALKGRLADMSAADVIDDLPVGQPQSGTYKNVDCVHIQLADSHRLTIVANHRPPRVGTHGATAWDHVRRVRVVALEALP